MRYTVRHAMALTHYASIVLWGCVGCTSSVPKMQSTPGGLYVSPGGHLQPGSFLYVQSDEKLRDRQPAVLGIVRVVERPTGAVRVAWYCSLAPKILMPKDGLPVALVEQGTDPLLGDCTGRYRKRKRTSRLNGLQIGLELDIGTSHGVEAGQEYRVLGEPMTSKRVLTGFEELGRCVIGRDGLHPGQSRCFLDRRRHQGFSDEHWEKGGLVYSEAPPPRIQTWDWWMNHDLVGWTLLSSGAGLIAGGAWWDYRLANDGIDDAAEWGPPGVYLLGVAAVIVGAMFTSEMFQEPDSRTHMVPTSRKGYP